MSATFLIARNEIRRQLRDRSALIRGLVAPFVLAAIMGLAFGTSSVDKPVKIAMVDQDGNAVTTIGPVAGVRFVAVPDRAAAVKSIKDNHTAAGIVVPAGFGAGLRAGHPPVVEILEGGNEFFAASAVAAAVQGLPARVATPTGGTRVEDDRVSAQSNPIGYFGPAVAMLFLFFTVGAGARSLMAENRMGTLARLRVAPISERSIMLGKTLATLVVALASLLILWGATALLFGANWGPVGAVILLCIATVIAIAGIAALVTAVARTEAEAESLTLMIGFGLALLGGNFFPPGALPDAFEKASRLTPNGVALQAFAKMSIDHAQLRAILPSVLVLIGLGLVFGTIAVRRLVDRAVDTPVDRPDVEEEVDPQVVAA